MRKMELKEILAKNPSVDRKSLEETLEMVRRLRADGVRSTAISASPPANPYSSVGGARVSERKEETDQNA